LTWESWVCLVIFYLIKCYSETKFFLVSLDLGTAGENVKRVKLYTFLRKHATGQATTELHIVHVERGMSWEGAVEKSAEAKLDTEGFYLSHQVKLFFIYYHSQC